VLYTPDNIQVSLTLWLADKLKQAGYNIRWQMTGDTEAHTAGGDALGTITLVKEAPENPEQIVVLNEGDVPAADEIPVPALTLQIAGPEESKGRYGLGHEEFFRRTPIRVDGFARNEFEQSDLVKLFQTWVGRGSGTLPISDYTNPNAPVVLEPAVIVRMKADKDELLGANKALRYYVYLWFEIEYVE
jgi:hypothetical protein